jgi:hypothetical protein
MLRSFKPATLENARDARSGFGDLNANVMKDRLQRMGRPEVKR